jgi:hypothetical protein
MQFSKLNRLIRDLRQLEKVGETLVKYYGDLKNQFSTGIALSDYPTIQWMDFGNICETVSLIHLIILYSGVSLTKIAL